MTAYIPKALRTQAAKDIRKLKASGIISPELDRLAFIIGATEAPHPRATGRILPRWSRESIHAVMTRCKDRRDFRLSFPSAYAYAGKKGWLAALYVEARLPFPQDSISRLMGE